MGNAKASFPQNFSTSQSARVGKRHIVTFWTHATIPSTRSDLVFDVFLMVYLALKICDKLRIN